MSRQRLRAILNRLEAIEARRPPVYLVAMAEVDHRATAEERKAAMDAALDRERAANPEAFDGRRCAIIQLLLEVDPDMASIEELDQLPIDEDPTAA